MGQTGRPTKYTKELGDLICSELSEGKSLRTVCKADDMPDKSTVFRWLRTDQDFQDQYTRAKQEAADALADEILDISDDGSNDWMDVEYGNKTVRKTDPEALQRSKLRVDTRKWLMSKMKPKQYGEHLKIDQDTEVTHKFEDMDDDQLDRAIEEAKNRLS